MRSSPRVRRSSEHRTIACGEDVRGPARDVAPAPPNANARIITRHGSPHWLVTVVARLVSESTTRPEIARLVLRFDSLTEPERQPRVVTVRARDLQAVPEETLRALGSAPAQRTRQVVLRPLRRRR